MMKMKMPTRTMTNSNCTPPSGLRSYGKVVYVFGTLPIIGFVVFACKILALFPLVGSCLLMFCRIFVFVYLRVCVFVNLGIWVLMHLSFERSWLYFLWWVHGLCMCVFAFVFHINVFVYLCNLYYALARLLFYVGFTFCVDVIFVLVRISLLQHLCCLFSVLIIDFPSMTRSHFNLGCTIRTGPSSSPTKM